MVGAGSAGCVLADRLIGGRRRGGAARSRPARLAPVDPRARWHPEAALQSAGQLELRHPTRARLAAARSIGRAAACSAAPVDQRHAVRPRQSRRLRQLVADGLPRLERRGCCRYFKSIERYAPGEPEQRGKGGPMLVEDYRTILPVTHRFVEAAQQAGIPFDQGSQRRASRKASAIARCRATAASAARPHRRSWRGEAAGRTCASRPRRSPLRMLFEGTRCVGVPSARWRAK